MLNESSNTPDNYSLSQNFPNPFNSSTIIRYKVIYSSDVKIKLFNIEGKELYVLVNEKQSRGSYEILFNSTDISSGIYFYSLYLDNNLVDTKKLIVNK